MTPICCTSGTAINVLPCAYLDAACTKCVHACYCSVLCIIYILYVYICITYILYIRTWLCIVPKAYTLHCAHVYLHTVTLATDSDGQARSLVKPILIGPRAT